MLIRAVIVFLSAFDVVCDAFDKVKSYTQKNNKPTNVEAKTYNEVKPSYSV